MIENYSYQNVNEQNKNKQKFPSFLDNVHQFEVSLQDFEKTKNQQFKLKGYKPADGKLDFIQQELEGSYSEESAEQYFQINREIVHSDNFTRLFDGRKISKISIGTQSMTQTDIQGDFMQYITIKAALQSGGINHIDTAPHFRYQQSERVVSQVLHTLNEKYGIPRSQFFISSKQGYSSFDELETCPRDIEVKDVIAQSNGKLSEKDFYKATDQYDPISMIMINEYRQKVIEDLQEKKKKGENIDQDIKNIDVTKLKIPEQLIHSIHPVWLEYSIKKSLDRLGVQKLDCVYLSNPLEIGLKMFNDPKEVLLRLGHAFAFLEELVQQGTIGSYGIHADHSLRLDPVLQGLQFNQQIKQFYLFQFQEIINIARAVSGTSDPQSSGNLKFLQMPFSVLQPEALTNRYQILKEKKIDRDSKQIIENKGNQSIFDICNYYKINFIAHRLLGGSEDKLMQKVQNIDNIRNQNYGKVIQAFKSSIIKHDYLNRMEDIILPECVKGVTIGMSSPESVQQNLGVLLRPNNSKIQSLKKYWDEENLNFPKIQSIKILLKRYNEEQLQNIFKNYENELQFLLKKE